MKTIKTDNYEIKISENGNSFSELVEGRNLTEEELIRAIRFAITAEYTAIQQYMEIFEATDNELAKKVLKEVADEEIVHAGEFLKLLKELSPKEQEFYDEGEKEEQKNIEKENF